GQLAIDDARPVAQFQPADAVEQFGIEPEGIWLAGRDVIENHEGFERSGGFEPAPDIARRGARQGEDDHQMDQPAQHDPAYDPEQQAAHGHPAFSMDGMFSIVVLPPENTTAS